MNRWDYGKSRDVILGRVGGWSMGRVGMDGSMARVGIDRSMG